MPVPVFLFESGGTKIYRIGRVGFDSGASDVGGAYTGTFRTEKISPLGEHGLVHFRRISLRVLRTGPFTITFKIFVDGLQTQRYDASGTLVNQTIVVTKGAPVNSPEEAIVEADITARGTYIEVEGTVLSTDVTGVFLPEELEVHYRPLREARQATTAETQ